MRIHDITKSRMPGMMGLCFAALLAVSLMSAASVMAQEKTYFTRAQWLKQIGASVNDAAVLKDTLVYVAPEDRVEFTRRILTAVNRMPVAPEEKAAVFVRTAVGCIAGIAGEVKMRVIAEVFAVIPIEYLPVVTEELAKRFNQEYNGLSDEQYEKFASETLQIAIDRNAQLDMPTVRNTFVILAFLRGTSNPHLENVLIALLPDERSQNLASGFVRSVDANNDYEPLLAAADVDTLPLKYYRTMMRVVGHSLMDRLLAELNENTEWDNEGGEDRGRLPTDESVWVPLSLVWQIAGTMMTPEGHNADFGINRVPRMPTPSGYQNQGTAVFFQNTTR